MLFITKVKLAAKDKKITRLFRDSNFYQKYRNIEKFKISYKDVELTEPWIKEVEAFIDIVLSERKFKSLIDEFSLSKLDLVHFYILMTIATMPNPLFLTGTNKMTNTLVGSAMYQEIEKQLMTCLQSLGQNCTKEEQDQFCHEYASDVMIFASQLKFAHEMAYGTIQLEDVL